jgi:hypothetical protein
LYRTNFILEPIPTRRIGPHGAHRQQKVDRERLIVLIDAGSSAASTPVVLKRSITVVQAKARSLGKPFQIAASHR